MTVEVKHTFQSPKGDGPDTSFVRPSDWNDVHDFVATGPALVGRPSAGAGPVTEVPIGSGLAFESGSLVSVLQALPIGLVVPFAGNTEPPGWLFCFGQALSRTVYTDLYAAIGTTYGVGDGATTFNLPDCRGRVPAGKDNMGGTAANRIKDTVDGNVLGSVVGTEKHALIVENLPAHSHTGTTGEPNQLHHHQLSSNETVSDASPSLATNAAIARSNASGSGSAYTFQSGSLAATHGASSDAGSHTHAFTTGETGAGAAHMNMQPSIIFNTIIWTGFIV